METLTLIDAVVAVIIITSALLAYSRGIMREVMAILGWVLAAVLAYVFAPQAMPLVKQIPMIGPKLETNCELGLIVAYGAVFAVVLLVASLFTPLLSSLIQRSILGGPDRALGFLFGVVRGVLLVAVGFFAYQTFLDAKDIAMVEDSRSAVIFGGMIGDFGEQDPSEAVGWLESRYYALAATCNR